MDESFKVPDECRDMADVRRGVDATDRQIMDLLDRRFGYMRAAARIKPDRGAVRDEERKAAVIEAVRHDAQNRALPSDRIAKIWELLVETSIAYEMDEWDRLRN
ncbi:chorismate mutase [Parerythrobacter lacustris]|uniref:chorismate mutase n=1 Tax=Parerythrobacter lacustris TaxID=2969984 RepID=A0ABT1XU65_9SPHN|nr:chorismate mutase [Parerythrobacter lacustris]MCR2833957.1 chorismate mutase [Parerythrobacter lacustris]